MENSPYTERTLEAFEILWQRHYRNLGVALQACLHRTGQDIEITTRGRHDPCVGIRAVPVGEAMVACVLADHLLRHRAQNPDAPTAARLPRN